MAARQRYPTPPQQLRELAGYYRGIGASFEEFWEATVRPGRPPVATTTPARLRPAHTIIWPSDSQDCRSWREAMAGVKDGWRRAYEGIPPTSGERSLTLLAPVLERIAAVEARSSAPSSIAA